MLKSRTHEQKKEAHCTWTNCFVRLKDLSNVSMHCACLHNGAKSKFKRKHCSPDWMMKRITHVMKRLKSLGQNISSYLSLSDAECTETLIIAVTHNLCWAERMWSGCKRNLLLQAYIISRTLVEFTTNNDHCVYLLCDGGFLYVIQRTLSLGADMSVSHWHFHICFLKCHLINQKKKWFAE